MQVFELNNQAKKLYDAGDLDGAERVLHEIERVLAARGPLVVGPSTLDRANDEWFYLSHRVLLGWSRTAYEVTLPLARRMYELEGAMHAARGPAYCTGAWALISFLTRCRQFREAEKVFAEVMRDDDFLYARRARNQGFVEKVFVAGMCAHHENSDVENYKRGHQAVERAQNYGTDDPELYYSYGLFWTRAGKIEKAIQVLDSAVRCGYDLEALVADPALSSLQEHPWFEGGFVDRVYPWKIKSQPSGARIWINGVDAGSTTPARFRAPPVGKHTIRLVLDGHLDHEDTIEQCGPQHGLDWTCQLTSVATNREREDAARDGTRVPGAAERERTRAFIGDRKGATVTVHRHTTYGLGGLTIIVHGDGRVELHKRGWARERDRDHRFRLADGDVDRVIDALIEHAFTEMNVGRNPGMPDELYISLALAGDAGEHQLGKFGSSPHPRFDALVATIVAVVAAHVPARLRSKLTL